MRTEVAERGVRGCPESFDFTADLAGHDHPVTIILGDTDYVDLGAGRWTSTCRESPSIRLRVIDNCGHNPWYDRPDEFRTELLSAFPAVPRS